MSANWSHLPPELISIIFEKVADSNISNLSNCAGVCVSWRSVRGHFVNNFSPTILLIDHGNESDENGNEGHYRIFNTGTRETQEIMLPELCGKRFRSVWPGWLLTSNYESPTQATSFLNPLTRAQISLPLLRGNKKDYNNLKMMVLSSNPSDSKCIFFLRAYGDVEGFGRLGDETWSTTTISYMEKRIWIFQAIYFNGDFYITGYSCCHRWRNKFYIYRVQIDENNMTPTVERLLCLPTHAARESNLVELMGELLLVLIYYEWPKRGIVAKMEIHKLELNGDDNRWVRVRSLGGKHAIYISHYQSVSIYVGESNSCAECQPNCVYVLGNRFIENAVFDVETSNYKKLYGFPSSYLLNWFRFK